MSLCATSALATDYEINPRVELAGGYDDNVNSRRRRTRSLRPTLWRMRASSCWHRSRTGSGASTPEVRGNWYSGHSDLDPMAEFLYLDGERSGERYMLDLYGYGASQSLITNYLPTANIGSWARSLPAGHDARYPGQHPPELWATCVPAMRSR